MTTLTQCQQQVLDMLISYQKERGFPPTNQEVATMLGYLAMNMLPDLCDESWLARHAAMKRCPRKGATAASGYMRWEGVSDGLKVTAGSVIQRDDLVQYTATADATSSGGVLRVPIACSTAGAVGNADDGMALPVVTPRPAHLPPIWMMTTLTCCRKNFVAWWRPPVPAWRKGGMTSFLPRFVRCC